MNDTMQSSKGPGGVKMRTRPSRFDGIVSVKRVLGLVLVVLLSAFAVPAYRYLRTVFAWEHVERTTLSVLKSENLSFLVTDRVVSQIVVEISENSPLLGKREGVLIGTVTLYYGVDLQQMDAACLSREGGTIFVKLPEPSELDFTVDPASFKYITKRSGLNVIADYLQNKDMEAELRTSIHAQAVKFMTDEKLLPSRDKIVRRLNDLASPIFLSSGLNIEFR